MITILQTPRAAYPLHLLDVLQEHGLPKGRVLGTELVRNVNAEAEVQDDHLVFFGVEGVRAHEDVPRVRVAVDKPRDEDLLCEAFDDVRDDSLLVEPVFFQLLIVSYLNSLYPLRHHHPLPSELINNLWYVQLVSLYSYKIKNYLTS